MKAPKLWISLSLPTLFRNVRGKAVSVRSQRETAFGDVVGTRLGDEFARCVGVRRHLCRIRRVRNGTSDRTRRAIFTWDSRGSRHRRETERLVADAARELVIDDRRCRWRDALREYARAARASLKFISMLRMRVALDPRLNRAAAAF